nr:putative integron gene cassette protein [uncultured bacterium]
MSRTLSTMTSPWVSCSEPSYLRPHMTESNMYFVCLLRGAQTNTTRPVMPWACNSGLQKVSSCQPLPSTSSTSRPSSQIVTFNLRHTSKMQTLGLVWAAFRSQGMSQGSIVTQEPLSALKPHPIN